MGNSSRSSFCLSGPSTFHRPPHCVCEPSLLSRIPAMLLCPASSGLSLIPSRVPWPTTSAGCAALADLIKAKPPPGGYLSSYRVPSGRIGAGVCLGMCRSREMKKGKIKHSCCPWGAHTLARRDPEQIIIQDKHCNKGRCQRVEGIRESCA